MARSCASRSLRASESNRTAHEKNRTDFGCIRLQPQKNKNAPDNPCGLIFFCRMFSSKWTGALPFFAKISRLPDFFVQCLWTNGNKKTAHQPTNRPRKKRRAVRGVCVKSQTSLVATLYSARNVDAPQSERRVL